MPKKHTFSPERFTEMVNMRKNGLSGAEIARRFNISRQRVQQILGKATDIKRTCPYCGTIFTRKTGRFCKSHCSTRFKQGSTPRKHIDLAIYLLNNIDPPGANGCWVWSGYKHPVTGYACACRNGKHIYAHRLMALLVFGDYVRDMLITHSCDNPPCVNPAHLVPGTPLTNAKDRDGKVRYLPPRRFSVKDVKEMRMLYQTTADLALLSSIYGVSKNSIYSIVTRHTYEKVP